MEILLLIFLFFIELLYILIWKSPRRIGRSGETEVAAILSKLSQSHYKVLNDVLIRSGDMTIQIDHIIVSIYGIFVIETKNYKGWIIGKETTYEWTQCIYNFKHTFYNPIKQNRAHVAVLKSILSLSDNFFIPIVVFTNRAELKVTSQSTVIYTSELLDFIERRRTQILFNLDPLIKKINSRIIKDDNTNSLHKMYVQNKMLQNKNIRNNLLNNRKCPDCGGDLIIRQGKYRAFIGCYRYPYCRYTRNL